MREIIFACVLGKGEGERDALRLACSIRTFGGEFCFNPIWMLSQRDEADLAETTRQELFSLGARLISFEMNPKQANFFLADYVTAAGLAESLAQGESNFVVMMAADTLVLQQPSAFILPRGKSLGACPVHLKILGSAAGEAIDDFWKLVYQGCQVDEDKTFHMLTVVDQQVVRAYFNAGLLVVKPERGLLRAWKADFDRLMDQPELKAFCQKDELYEIFMHQAVLAGSVLSRLGADGFQQLPFEVNYPLHLHSQVAKERRPVSLDELITCRYEEFAETFGEPGVRRLVENSSVQNWIEKEILTADGRR